MTNKTTISDGDIENGLNIVAGLIDDFGDAYWPIFDRLERELEERRSRSARLRARLSMADRKHRNHLTAVQ